MINEFQLADYRQIKVKRKDALITQEEVEKTLEFIRKSRVKNGSPLPQLNDEFAKSLGHFKNLEDLKRSVFEGLKQEKELKESRRIQAIILNKIVQNTKVKAPLAVKKVLILQGIAKKENIKVEAEEVKEKINQLLENFTTIEEVEKNIDLAKFASQVHRLILSQKVLAFLEKELVQ